MPDFRVRIRLSLDGPGIEASNVRTSMFNAACENAGMTRRGTGAYQHDSMSGTALHSLLTAISNMAVLPGQDQTTTVDHLWLHVERVTEPETIEEH